MKKVFLGLGSNLGDKRENLYNAKIMIEESIGQVIDSSSIYESDPWGFESKDKFLNMVLVVETSLTPTALLKKILDIESRLGRIRGEAKFISRIIDIDILLYNNLIVDDSLLKIPHPRIPERKFVLVPLCEVAAELIHPVCKKTILTMLNECKDHGGVVMYKKKRSP
jgi:2-amino-4-hydroxy-6-hydroxymethyldihydropteridine diphosphokinase